MIKSELLQVLKEKRPDPQANLAPNCLLEQLISALTTGERIEILSFGINCITSSMAAAYT